MGLWTWEDPSRMTSPHPHFRDGGRKAKRGRGLLKDAQITGDRPGARAQGDKPEAGFTA